MLRKAVVHVPIQRDSIVGIVVGEGMRTAALIGGRPLFTGAWRLTDVNSLRSDALKEPLRGYCPYLEM